MSTQERRNEQRWNIKNPLRVFDENTNKLLGRAINISMKGLRLISEEPLPLDEHYDLVVEINLKSENIPTKAMVSMRALSIWSEKGELDLYQTGFHIFSMPKNSTSTLEELIEKIKRKKD